MLKPLLAIAAGLALSLSSLLAQAQDVQIGRASCRERVCCGV